MKQSMSQTNWKTKILSRKEKRSETPGKDKGLNCRATPLEKWFAKCNRSYKNSRYGDWCAVKHGNKPTRKLS